MKHPKGGLLQRTEKHSGPSSSGSPHQDNQNQKLRRRTVRRPSVETRPSLCDEGLISRALLLGEPAEPHQGKYGEEEEEEGRGGGRLFMGAPRQGKCTP